MRQSVIKFKDIGEEDELEREVWIRNIFSPLSLFLLIMKVFRTTVEENEDLALFRLTIA